MTANVSIQALAKAAGLQVQWTDAHERAQVLGENALQRLLKCLELPADTQSERRDSHALLQQRARDFPPLLTTDVSRLTALPAGMVSSAKVALRDQAGDGRLLQLDPAGAFVAPAAAGYYQLECGSCSATLAVAPPRCFGPADAATAIEPRLWGVTAQLYSLRCNGDGGLATMRSVGALAEVAAAAGADALCLSPVHAIAPVTHGYSPYSPSHRGYLNGLFADPRDALGEDALRLALERSGLAAAWERAEAQPLIDWPSIAAMRTSVWRTLYESFDRAGQGAAEDFRRFERDGGPDLRAHALFSARQAKAALQHESLSWRDWGSGWAGHGSCEPTFFASSYADDLGFEVFTQWLASRSWQQAKARADNGMRLGLITDIAVGFEPGGSEAWRNRGAVLNGLSLGAPPDAFNANGQQWGVTNYAPYELVRSGFRPFLEVLRANMSMAGGIRLDHVLGLARLWVVPQDAPATEGGYLSYPLLDLLRLVALESWRHRCMVIGEDLGTVPVALRAELAARGLFGTDVLLFNRDENGAFLPPSKWRRNAVATTTTHDLPPLKAWQTGADITAKARVESWSEAQADQARQHRREEVEALRTAVHDAAPAIITDTFATKDFTAQAIRHVASSAAELVLIPMEDVLELEQQPNVPGTVDEFPNWRQRLPAHDAALFAQNLAIVDQAREVVDP